MGKPSSPSSSLSSSKQAQVSILGVSMEPHKVKQQEQPRLSGAYIRSLVKHLTTSVKSKDTFNEEYPKLPDSISSNKDIIHQESSQPPPPPQQPYKKQVRRRQHATKPYQERLLNMAEARREIVTALRFHRASKQRQASGEHCSPEASAAAVSNTTAAVPSYYWHVHNNNNPPPLPTQTINFALPNQTLGLNLNLQDFKALDTNLYRNPQSNYYSTSSSSSSSPSTSSSAAIATTAAGEEVTVAEKVVAQTPTTSSVTSSSIGVHHTMDDEVIAEEAVTTTTSSITSSSEGLHCALDDEGMEEIKSLGEQHQMEWNDTVNMLTYAQWFTFLKTIETEQAGENEVNRINEFHPCMDNGEFEGMNGEWLV